MRQRAMKLRIEATPDELREKAPALVKALADQLADYAPGLAESLEKAAATDSPVRDNLKYPVLRGLFDKTSTAYGKTTDRMISDIGKVLRNPESVRKSDKIPGGLADDKTAADFDAGKLAEGVKVEMEHTTDRAIAQEIAQDHLTEDPDYYRKLKTIEKASDPDTGVDVDPDEDPDTGEPIFDPKTGDTPSEQQEAKESGEAEEPEDEDGAEKSGPPVRKAVQHMHGHDYDFPGGATTQDHKDATVGDDPGEEVEDEEEPEEA